MKQIHSYWAYIAVLILIVAFINAVMGMAKKRSFTDKDLRISLFTLIVMHIQLLIGLGWYFMSPWFKALKDVGMSAAMKDAQLRLFSIEHPTMMVLAIVFITIGWSKHKKKTTDKSKFKTIMIFYGIGLFFVLTRMPWKQWLNL